MRAAFLGTPSAAVPSLAALIDVVDVDVVVTRPDRAKGRSGKPTPPPVKLAAREWGLTVLQPESRGELDQILQDAPIDVGVVVAYGRILTPAALASAPAGFVNVHFSLLPRWRGAAPVERAILEGDASTGVTLMQLDEGLDTGPVIAAVETPIAPDETGGSLTGRLAYLGGMLIDDAMSELLAGRLDSAPQLSAGVTIAKQLDRSEGRIDPSWTAEYAERAIRAFSPRPGAWFSIDGTRCRVHRASHTTEAVTPGAVAPFNGVAVLGLEGGSLALDLVQPAGKATMTGTAWLNGRRGAGGHIDPPTE
ncbi:MAG: methionyl-tRNA formyltransferase [Actinomycetota bacterium]|nr:methionyl-tRNA formyltransferase [Actinomycetota bacterium]